MRTSINFNHAEDDEGFHCPLNPELETSLTEYHEQLMQHCRLFEEEVEEITGEDNSSGIVARLLGLDNSQTDTQQKQEKGLPPGTLPDVLYPL